MEKDRRFMKELMKTLKGLGFTSYEATILAHLSLIREPLGATELSSLTGVPRTKVYSVVSSLESEGIVRVQEGRPLRFSAPPPNELASLIVEKVLSETSTKLSLLEEIFRLNLTEGLWVTERSTIPVRGERVMSRIAMAIVRDAKERVNLILSERNIHLIPRRSLDIVSAVVESISTQRALGIPRTSCRVVGKHDIFMVLSERACLFGDGELKQGIFTSEEGLLSAFSNLFKGLYAAGIIPPK